jgi:1-acyl-sn-glycerol-3-phosphate acyltransferase
MQALQALVRRVRLTCVFYLVLLWLGAMLLLGNLACILLIPAPRSLREPFLQRMISGTFRLFLAGCAAGGIMRLDLSAIDTVNRQRGLVLVANHPSMIDVFLIISRVRQGVCLMKDSLTANVFLALGARLAGYISNKHTDQMIRQAAHTVASGGTLLVFPESTRTEHQPISTFQPGAALIAKRAKVPIQLIFLETNSQYLAKGWPIWRAPPFPMMFKARLGDCVMPESSVRETTHELQQRFERALHLSINPDLRF